MNNEKFNYLETEYEKVLKSSATPFNEDPRPQLKRDSYLCLNSEWDFLLLDKKKKIKH